MLVENGQRADVPALEEAESYRQLRDEHGVGVPQIASDVGRSDAHVYQRLKLTELVSGVQELLKNGNLQIRSALLFARLDEKGQHQALKALRTRHEYLIDEGGVLNHREVDHFVLLGTRKLAHAKWSLDDKELVPAAGSCLDCGKRTHAQAQLFQIGDTDSDDACVDPGCWEGKVNAQADRDLALAFETGQELIDPKEAKSLWTYGNEPVAGWLDVEQHLEWTIRRPNHVTTAERDRALHEAFPERAATRRRSRSGTSAPVRTSRSTSSRSCPRSSRPNPKSRQRPGSTSSASITRRSASRSIRTDTRDASSRKRISRARSGISATRTRTR